jgi:hypothetical protein
MDYLKGRMTNEDWDEGGGYIEEAVEREIKKEHDVAFAAGAASEKLNADKFREEFVKEYGKIHREVVEQAKQEGIQIGRKEVVDYVDSNILEEIEYIGIAVDWANQCKAWFPEKKGE